MRSILIPFTSGAMTYFTPRRGDFRTYRDGTHCCVGSDSESNRPAPEAILSIAEIPTSKHLHFLT
jgi:hypothetical protein